MKRIRVNIDQISDLDLKLARNPRITSVLDEIIPLSLEERAQRHNALQQKIQQGEANLFEEHVLAKLLEERKAEWIRVIHKNLPALEQEIQKRSPNQSFPTDSSPASSSHPPTSPASSDEYPSELLEFLSTQKPPPVSAKPSGKYDSPTRSGAKKRSSLRFKDVVVGMVLLAFFLGSVWYVHSSENTSQNLTTFDSQNRESSEEQRLSEQQQLQFQDQFDVAVQELHFGEFEHGKTQLLELIEMYPDYSQAAYAYIVIADASRQRQNKTDEALTYYHQFIERYPESQYTGLAQLKMGFTYEDMGDLANAEQMYRLVIKNKGERSRLGQLAHERLSRLQKK